MILKKHETILLVLLDFFSSLAALFIFYLFKFRLGVVDNPVPLSFGEILLPSLLISGAWVLVFWFTGLYTVKSPSSRLDEAMNVFKTLSAGTLILFIVTIQMTQLMSFSRLLVITYWLGLVIIVTGNRIIFRSMQRKQFINGIGLLPSILVGWNDRSKSLSSRIKSFPGLGYEVIGYISTRDEDVGKSDSGGEVLGSISDLPKIIQKYSIKEVILSLSSNDHERLLDVINYVNGESVGIKISPDMYDIISGQARTNQIYGLPLIDILPELMPAWERSMKRLVDIVVSTTVLTIFLPIWLLLGIIIKLDSKGSILYRQERVGRDEQIFEIFK